jgi:hypothetical protein
MGRIDARLRVDRLPLPSLVVARARLSHVLAALAGYYGRCADRDRGEHDGDPREPA